MKNNSDHWGDTFEVKPYMLFMEINGGDINWGFLNELIKNHGGDIVRGDTFHGYHLPQFSSWTWKLCLLAYFSSQYWQW